MKKKLLPTILIFSCAAASSAVFANASLVYSHVNTNHSLKRDYLNKVKSKADDSSICHAIEARLYADKIIPKKAVDVNVDGGYVRLTGKVSTNMQYMHAVKLADSVKGVTNVNAHDLKITVSKKPIQDIKITSKVKAKIFNAHYFRDIDVRFWPVHIETKNKVVYLTGSVASKEEKQNIGRLAGDIDNVHHIKNYIRVVGA